MTGKVTSMNRIGKILHYGIIAAALTVLAACGGGGGGGAAGDGGAAGAFTTTTLQTLPGTSFSSAAAINRNHEAVGLSDGTSAAPDIFKAVAWTVAPAGTATTSTVFPLAMPPDAGAYSAAYGINDGGEIVGELQLTPGGSVGAAYWPTRTATPAEVVLLERGASTRSAAYDINNTGRIVGELDFGNTSEAVTWAGPAAAPEFLPMAAGQFIASAFSINDAGEIVGELIVAGRIHAALWRPNAAGAYVDAPILLPSSPRLNSDSTALTINAAGDIVGEILEEGTGKVHAALWTRGAGGSYALVDLGSALEDSSASGINDGGRIVGHAHVTADALPAARTWLPGSSASSPIDATRNESQAFAVNQADVVVGIADNLACVAVPQ